MRRLLLAGLALCAGAAVAGAHPGAGIAVGRDGSVLFVDSPKNRILRIDREGKTSVLFEDASGARLRAPHHLTVATDGSVLTASDTGGVVWRVSPQGAIEKAYPPEGEPGVTHAGVGGNPFAVGEDGALYVLVTRQDVHASIVRVAPDGRLKVLAGGDWGFADGRGTGAKFGDLHGSSFVVGSEGAIYLTDSGTCVRRVLPDGSVATLAGAAEAGFADGPSAKARFRGAMGVALDPSGAIYVADRENHRVRKIDAEEDVVTTIAGTGEPGSTDGPALSSRLSYPAGVARSPSGALFILEHPDGLDAPRVRRLSPDGKTLSTVSAEGRR